MTEMGTFPLVIVSLNINLLRSITSHDIHDAEGMTTMQRPRRGEGGGMMTTQPWLWNDAECIKANNNAFNCGLIQETHKYMYFILNYKEVLSLDRIHKNVLKR